MKSAIMRNLPDALNHEVYFEPPAKAIGWSDRLVVVNAPWELDGEVGKQIAQL
jgi:23S rRNA (adenine2030-N6)-methyltransferase